MRISNQIPFGANSPYRISSIHGNPNSLNPISKVEKDGAFFNKALVIAQKAPEQTYVKDYGELTKTTSTSFGDFAQLLSMQTQSSESANEEATTSLTSSYEDMLGMMGTNYRVMNMLFA